MWDKNRIQKTESGIQKSAKYYLKQNKQESAEERAVKIKFFRTLATVENLQFHFDFWLLNSDFFGFQYR